MSYIFFFETYCMGLLFVLPLGIILYHFEFGTQGELHRSTDLPALWIY